MIVPRRRRARKYRGRPHRCLYETPPRRRRRGGGDGAYRGEAVWPPHATRVDLRRDRGRERRAGGDRRAASNDVICRPPVANPAQRSMAGRYPDLVKWPNRFDADRTCAFVPQWPGTAYGQHLADAGFILIVVDHLGIGASADTVASGYLGSATACGGRRRSGATGPRTPDPRHIARRGFADRCAFGTRRVFDGRVLDHHGAGHGPPLRRSSAARLQS
jgi:hypothetical protein